MKIIERKTNVICTKVNYSGITWDSYNNNQKPNKCSTLENSEVIYSLIIRCKAVYYELKAGNQKNNYQIRIIGRNSKGQNFDHDPNITECLPMVKGERCYQERQLSLDERIWDVICVTF